MSSLTRRPTTRRSSTSPMPTLTTPRSVAQSRSSLVRPMSLIRAIAITAGGLRSLTRPRSSSPDPRPTCASTSLAGAPSRAQGDGFTVLEDSEVRFASKGDSQLPIRLRRLLVQRTDGNTITLLTNDLERAAVDIATLYKARWQIELLFRWIKQHLRIRRFLGNNDNAIRLQLFAAMIAYALLRIAACSHCIKISILRFTDLVALCLLERRRVGAIDKPPPVNPSRPQCRNCQNQLTLSYA